MGRSEDRWTSASLGRSVAYTPSDVGRKRKTVISCMKRQLRPSEADVPANTSERTSQILRVLSLTEPQGYIHL